MALEVVGFYRDSRSLYEECKKCQSYHAIIVMKDGSMCDGIIEEVNDDSVTILVGENVIEKECAEEANRQGPFGHGQPGGFRRFRRRNFPMRNIDRVGPLRYPYIIPPYPIYQYPYPYPYPYYPYI